MWIFVHFGKGTTLDFSSNLKDSISWNVKMFQFVQCQSKGPPFEHLVRQLPHLRQLPHSEMSEAWVRHAKILKKKWGVREANEAMPTLKKSHENKILGIVLLMIFTKESFPFLRLWFCCCCFGHLHCHCCLYHLGWKEIGIVSWI